MSASPDLRVTEIKAFEILDSRGNPTLAVQLVLVCGARGEFMVPSGASTGAHEVVEARDGDPARYSGKGVRLAVERVEGEIARSLRGMDAADQQAIDRRLIELDGTPHKSRLGANAMLGVSGATARAGAIASGVPLWKWLAGARKPALPLPMINIFSGGLHAGGNIEFQDYLAIPHGFDTFAAALEAVVQIHRKSALLTQERGYVLTGVADEGGWGPKLESNETALELLTGAIERAGYQPGREVSIGIDVASSHFFNGGRYALASEHRSLTSDEMIGQLDNWSRRFPVISIEDGLAEDDWDGWKRLTQVLGARVQLIGDDLFTTDPVRLRRGIAEGAANAVLVKMNQIGTLTETFEVIDLAREAGYRAVISARSGETEDSFLADLAVASGAGQIKVGSITRSERLAKYNRLLQIERLHKEVGWAAAGALGLP